jgi:hypothetical protein
VTAERSPSHGAIALVVLGSLMAGAGLLQLSSATSGVGLIGFACFLAIVARLAQASVHQRNAFRAGATAAPPPAPSPVASIAKSGLVTPKNVLLLLVGLAVIVVGAAYLALPAAVGISPKASVTTQAPRPLEGAGISFENDQLIVSNSSQDRWAGYLSASISTTGDLNDAYRGIADPPAPAHTVRINLRDLTNAKGEHFDARQNVKTITLGAVVNSESRTVTFHR